MKMYLIELNELIEGGENESVEFKRKFSSPEKIAKEMIAFANSKGGRLLFGVDDDKSIVGVESEKGELELISTAAKFYCEPEIEFHTEIMLLRGKDIVVVTIEESKNKPHMLFTDDTEKGQKVYIRFKDRSMLASKETVKILKNSNADSPPLQISVGDIEKALFEFLNKNERITVKGFKKLANISERRASRTLVNLVKAKVIRHHFFGSEDYFTLV
ncbi:MAG TPA: ATP-binding protein [Ignavibacteria bacterium]|nr:ATP-binding protein [Ignavibacteria bacterium]HRJ99353.1 ATP-binding protein [Ignavibacteria bacterium]